MPDALSKTVPIWCAVLNRALFPTETAFHPVQLPPNYLGESEESQIEYRIDGFVSSLKVRLHPASITRSGARSFARLTGGEVGAVIDFSI